MIAETIARPVELARPGADVERQFHHLLVAVVARAQHHAVLAERDRPAVVIGRDVSDGQNRHGALFAALA